MSAINYKVFNILGGRFPKRSLKSVADLMQTRDKLLNIEFIDVQSLTLLVQVISFLLTTHPATSTLHHGEQPVRDLVAGLP